MRLSKCSLAALILSSVVACCTAGLLVTTKMLVVDVKSLINAVNSWFLTCSHEETRRSEVERTLLQHRQTASRHLYGKSTPCDEVHLLEGDYAAVVEIIILPCFERVGDYESPTMFS